jgi:hypothetical protein
VAGAIPTQAAFRREYGCSEAEWLGWIPGATQGLPLQRPAPSSLMVTVGAGQLRLRWEVLEPRVIALMRLPRLQVDFEFVDVALDDRVEFLRVFDRHLQRGGG